MAKQIRTETKATIWIVESLAFSDENTHKEGEIISRTLRLSGKRTDYTYLRTRKELEMFLKEFEKSSHRYLHISCHGYKAQFYTTTEMIAASEFADLLAPNVNNRRVFFSTCLAVDDRFAEELLSKSRCRSVLGPIGEINFDDAAIFWTTFYHLMFKTKQDLMRDGHIIEHGRQCAKLVGGKFRFFYRKKDGKLAQECLG